MFSRSPKLGNQQYISYMSFQEEEVAKLEGIDEERGLWTKVREVFCQDLEFDLTPFKSIPAMQD